MCTPHNISRSPLVPVALRRVGCYSCRSPPPPAPAAASVGLCIFCKPTLLVHAASHREVHEQTLLGLLSLLPPYVKVGLEHVRHGVPSGR